MPIDGQYSICEAFARQEGWYAQVPKATRCQRNNNPGNIRYGNFALHHNAVGKDSDGFAIFSNPQDGFNCMSDLLIAAYLGLTLKQAVYKWAPPFENDSNVYVQNVCSFTGLNPYTILTADLLRPPQVEDKNV